MDYTMKKFNAYKEEGAERFKPVEVDLVGDALELRYRSKHPYKEVYEYEYRKPKTVPAIRYLVKLYRDVETEQEMIEEWK